MRNASCRLAFTASAFFALAPIFGDTVTATWVNRSDRTDAVWGDIANWTGVTVVPTNGEDVVLAPFDNLPSSGNDADIFQLQRIGTAASNKGRTFVDPVVGTLTGDKGYTLLMDRSDENTVSLYLHGAGIPYSADGFRHRFFDVANPNGFLGFWEPKGVFGEIRLHPTENFVPRLSHLSALNRPFIDVPGEGTVAEIAHLYDGGMLDKKGEGMLSVKSTDGKPVYYWLRGGSLELAGPDDGALEELLGRAALHLDAADGKSLVTTADPDGSAVTRWNDVRGNGAYAFWRDDYEPVSNSRIAFVNPPLLLEDASPTGLPLVDFGGRNAIGSVSPNDCSRTNCVLEIGPARISGIKALFYVAQCPYGAHNAVVLGDTSSWQMVPGSDTCLYDTVYSDPAVRYGDITINGKRTLFNALDNAVMRQVHVFASDYPSDSDVKVGLLGSREYYQSTTGGSRIGAVIAFTNELTRAERMLVADYLHRRWISGLPPQPAARGVNALENTAEISVPEGKIAEVERVYAEKGLVKTGGGKLEIASLEPAGRPVEVQGGSVAFRPYGSSGDVADVPADAYIWLDAASMEESEYVSGTQYLKSWKDRRGGDISAVSGYAEGTHMPTVKTSPYVSHPVVDFGTYGRIDTDGYNFDEGCESAAWMKFPNWNTKTHPTYNYFIVIRFKYDYQANREAMKSISCLSSSDMSGYRDSTPMFSANYCNPATLTAKWTVDGVVVEPSQSLLMNNVTNRFFVVAASATMPFTADGLAKDRDSISVASNCGGIEVGEVIAFDRRLDEAEHHAVEAYLMKKWLGKDHPVQADSAVSSVRFAEGLDVVYDSSCDMALNSVEGGNGNVVKRGEGTVTVTGFSPDNVDTVTVEAGEFSLGSASEPLIEEALFHFDAAAENSFVYDENGDVLKWKDVRNNGIFAEADSDGLANIRPKRIEVEDDEGVVRVTVDFGALSWTTNGVGSVKDAASMRFRDADGLCEFQCKDAFSVFADAHGSKQQSVFSGVTSCEFNRGMGGTILNYNDSVFKDAAGKSVFTDAKCTGVAANSYMYLDGKGIRSGSTRMIGDGFHCLNWLLSTDGIVQHDGWTDTHKLPIRGFARWNPKGTIHDTEVDRRGGMYVSEQFGFARILLPEERARVQRYLDSKWFGAANTNSFDAFSVAAGATLRLACGANIVTEVSSLSGAGTVVAPGGIAFGGTLNAALSNGSADCLEIEGGISFTGPVQLVVTIDPAGDRLEESDYPVLAAGSIDGFVKEDWTLVMPDSFDGKAKIVKVGDTVYLRIVKNGMTIIVR